MKNLISKALIATVIFLGALVLWQRHSDNRDFQNWPTTTVNLTSAEVAQGRTKHGSRYFIVQTEYDFMVDGRRYTSNLSRIGERRFDTDKEALLALAELKARQNLTVHHDPSNPERNALSR